MSLNNKIITTSMFELSPTKFDMVTYYRRHKSMCSKVVLITHSYIMLYIKSTIVKRVFHEPYILKNWKKCHNLERSYSICKNFFSFKQEKKNSNHKIEKKFSQTVMAVNNLL